MAELFYARFNLDLDDIGCPSLYLHVFKGQKMEL